MLCISSDARTEPPYVLQRSGYSLVLGQLRIKVDCLHAHQFEVLVHDGSAQLVCGQLKAEEE